MRNLLYRLVYIDKAIKEFYPYPEYSLNSQVVVFPKKCWKRKKQGIGIPI